jgi:uncharacterized membrane protein HdeD (DUF308 family)
MKSMNYSLIRTICALVIGLVLVLWPDAAINYIVITIGVLFLIPGFIVLIGYFGTKPEPGVSRRFPIEGVGSLLFGLWLVTMPGFFADVLMLYEANVVGTPGVGFGPSGEGYIRLTAFGERDDCIEAMRRIKNRL